jgi:transcription-repair coupling factor (superfamily II helicase)
LRTEREYGQIKKSYEELRFKKRRYPFLITGLCEGALDAFLASFTLDEKNGKTALIIAPDETAANRLRVFLENCGLNVGFYPSRRPVLYNIVSSHELEHARLACLAGILSGELDAVVTVPEAALQYTAPKEKITMGAKTVAVGDILDLAEFARFLVSMGYVSCDLVDGRGQFSTRGGILDIFPPHLPMPVRMELFGDEVDSIGYFDVMTQRKTENIQTFSVMCAREVMPDEETKKSLTPQQMPTMIAQKMYMVSRASLIAVRKRTIESAPTIPSDSAKLLPMTVITVPVRTVRTTRETLNFLL